MKLSFIPIDYSYFDFEGRNYAKIIGRDENGKRVCIIDSCPIYLWAILKDKLVKQKIDSLIKEIEKISLDTKGRETKVEKVELHDKKFLGKKVKTLKIFATNYKDLHDIADKLGMPEIEKRRGYDLGFITHYIIEKKLKPLSWYEIEGKMLNNSNEFGGIDSVLEVDFVIKVQKIKEIETKKFRPKVLAYDIETDAFKIGEGEILMISLVSDEFKKVLTYKSPKEIETNLEYVEYVKDETELLEKFVEYVKKISPDFLVGYYSDGFDLPYLKARAEKFNVKLSLGLDDSQPKFSRGINITAKINGIAHIDILKFIRSVYSQYMQSETLSLNEVAKEFLGDTKKDFKFKHSSKIAQDEWEKYYEYNLHDSILTFKLFEKLWPDLSEFTKIIQEPIFDVSRNGMSANVEDYIIHHLKKFNEIPEKRPMYDEISERKAREKYQGAFVFQPTPGLYENLAIFDFTSMHASIIVSYNISKSTLLQKKEEDSYESPELELNGKKTKFYFSKKSGFFPELLREIVELRKKYKRELKPDAINPILKARSNAFKLLANAYYGYLGFFGARYYCIEAAASTLAFVRKYNQETIEKVIKEGYKVIFGDTDSVGFSLNKKSKGETLKFLKKLNEKLPGIMELELEDFYKRGIWVAKRTGEAGAKKKYALIDEHGKLKIRGFETVRRDWCALAREVQNNVIKQILNDGNEKKALEYVKEIIKQIKERKINKEKIMIRTQLKKPISEYRNISPHVIAAKKMEEQEIPVTQGNLVEYYIAETRDKKKLVREKVKLPNEKGEYNLEYYLTHQILPAVENIFQVFNVNVKEIVDGKKQMTLGEF
ncbi:MAG: DNA polymerase I [archaeon GW2011_AR19]|nr:MAG: DNA polymerase I [archaeon GW2011_AR19]